MKSITIFFISAIVLAMPISAFSKFIVVASKGPERNVSTFIEKQAEYLISELTIKNDDRDPIKRFGLLEKAQQALLLKAYERDGVSVDLLPVQLEIDRHSKLLPSFNSASLRYRVLVSLSDYKNDFLAASLALRKLIDELPEIEDTQYELSIARLGIENPEKYRNEILEKISTDLADLKTRFGNSMRIKLSGLESPVRAEQLQDTKISVYINYQIELKINNTPPPGSGHNP